MKTKRYNELISEISDLDNQIESLESQISDMEDELICLNSDLDKLRIKRSNLEYDIDDML